MQVAVSILAVLTMVFAWLYWQREQALIDVQAQNAALEQAYENQRISDAEDSLQADTADGQLSAISRCHVRGKPSKDWSGARILRRSMLLASCRWAKSDSTCWSS